MSEPRNATRPKTNDTDKQKKKMSVCVICFDIGHGQNFDVGHGQNFKFSKGCPLAFFSILDWKWKKTQGGTPCIFNFF